MLAIVNTFGSFLSKNTTITPSWRNIKITTKIAPYFPYIIIKFVGYITESIMFFFISGNNIV